MDQGFDQRLKESLSKQKVIIPIRTEDVIRSTLDSLPEKRKRRPVGFLVAVCIFGLGIVATSIFITNPQTLADNFPILSSIQKQFNLGNQYVKVTDPTKLFHESNGIKVTILNTVFDGVELFVSYKVESEKAFNSKPILFTDEAFINSKNEGWLSASNEYGEFLDKNHTVYEGVTRFIITPESMNWRADRIDESINVAQLPNEFTLKLQLDRLGGIDGQIKGNWNFDVPIKTQKAKEFVKEVEIGKQFSDISPNVKLENVIVTPTRIYLEGGTDENSPTLNYIVVDEKGVTKKWVGGEARQSASGTFGIISYYENDGKEPKSLTFIPFIYNKLYDQANGVRLNMNGETTLPIDGERTITITRAVEKEGKTYLYYTSNSPVSSYLPFILMDMNGGAYNRNLKESSEASIGNETVLVFNGNLLNKEIVVVNPNKVYYDQAFEVKIP